MKRGYLGILQGAYLAGQSAAYQHMLQERGIAVADSSIPLEKMIYVAAFQGGIEKFVTPLKAKSDHPIDRFMSARMSKPKQRDSELLHKLMALDPGTPAEANNLQAWKALVLICDLISAMENNAAVINISGIPKVEDVRQELPPDVALPVCTILSALKSTDELLPAPSQTVDREVVGRFKDLLNSDVYHRYTRAHEAIELEVTESALSDIRSRGAKLLKASKGLLANRRVSVNTISVVPKIVDAAFGRLPGTLAQFAGELATKFLDEKKNIVIYQFDDWFNEYTKANILHLLRKRIPLNQSSNSSHGAS